MNEDSAKELIIISLQDQSGKMKRLFFSSPEKTTKEMFKEIIGQTKQLSKEGVPIERLCKVAEIIAEKHKAERVPH